LDKPGGGHAIADDNKRFTLHAKNPLPPRE
jgi:hypothetical protein